MIRFAIGATLALAVLLMGGTSLSVPTTAQPSTVVIEVSESVVVGDSLGTAPPASAEVGEAVGVDDAVQVAPPASAEVSEAVAVDDAVQVAPPASIDVAESVGVGDSVQVAPPVGIDVAESVGVSDSVQVAPPVSIDVAESVGVSDSVQVAPPVSIEVTESVGVSDSVQVEPAPVADVRIAGQALVDPPTDIDVGEDVPITLEKVLHNMGDYGPVDVGISATASAPRDCSATPDPANPGWANLPVSLSLVVSETWTIRCDTPSQHVFSFNNQVTIQNPAVFDPDTRNNSASTQLTVWAEPDTDGDGFVDAVELYVGTDPLDSCSHPLDIDGDGVISVTGDVINYVGRIGATPGDPNWRQRLDLDMGGDISVTGDVALYVGRIGEMCR